MTNLKSGTCPSCGSTEIYTTKGRPKRGERVSIAISSLKSFFLDTYICISCGHFEEFIEEKDLKDEKKMEKIRKTWRRVG